MAASGQSSGGPVTSCPRCSCAVEPGDIRCAVCALPVTAPPPPGGADAASLLRCGTCGASVVYEIESRSPRCPFCGSPARVEKPEDPPEEVRRVVPFLVDAAGAQGALRRWMKKLGFFRPSDLASASTMDSLRPLWWTAWAFDARALVSWAADSDAGSGRSAWAPHSGQAPMDFDGVIVPASRGLTDAECAALSRGYDLSTARPDWQGPPRALRETFGVQRSSARRAVMDAVSITARSRLGPIVPGSRIRNLKTSVLLDSLRTDRLALPAWVLAYRYKGKLHRAIVSGTDAGIVLGSAPYSVLKILAVVLAGLAALGLLGLGLALLLAILVYA